MNCRDFQAIIPDFLDDKLSGKKTKAFLEHMNSCEECKEELRIQYLVREGTVRLEEGDSFDLNKELDLKIEETTRMLKKRKISNIVIYCLEAVGIVAVTFILLLVFTR